jgi:5-methylcytosine-specific restriction endonuclease McrA
MPSVNKIQRPWIKPSETQSEKKTDPFYLSTPWRKLRKYVLQLNPLCFYCKLKGITTLAVIGDHFRPRKLYPEQSLEQDNIKGCCEQCHNIKRAFERTIYTKEQFERKVNDLLKHF